MHKADTDIVQVFVWACSFMAWFLNKFLDSFNIYPKLIPTEFNHKGFSVLCHSTELFCEKLALLADGPKKRLIKEEYWSLIVLIKYHCAMQIQQKSVIKN